MRKILLFIIFLCLNSCGNGQRIIDSNLLECIEKLEVTADDEVTELYCQHMEVKDLSGIGRFKNLNTLYLEHNQIKSIVPLGSLTELKSVYLSYNPVLQYSTFQLLPKISQISISSFNIDDIRTIASVRSIEYLGLEGSELTDEMIMELGLLPDLLHLGFDSTGMNSFPNLESLESLAWLSIQNENNLTDMSNIELLTNLVYLSISEVSHDISYIKALTELEHLTISGEDTLELETISKLDKLKYFDIYNSGLTGDISLLANMSTIESLKVLNVYTLTCDELRTLEDTFGDIYFKHFEDQPCIE